MLQTCVDEPILDLTNETLLVQFLGRPRESLETEISTLANQFVSTYNTLTETLCPDDAAFRKVTAVEIMVEPENVTVNDGAMSAIDSRATRVFHYRYTVQSQCRGCLDADIGLFQNGTVSDTTTGGQTLPCGRCIAPTLETFLQTYRSDVASLIRGNSLTFIDEVQNITTFVRVLCEPDESTFESDVIIDFVGDPSKVTPEQIATLERAFLETYNNLNAFDPTTCDPFFREVTQVQVVDEAATYNRRRLEDSNETAQLYILPLFFNIACMACVIPDRPFVYRLLVRGRCHGCARDAELYDDANQTSGTTGGRRLEHYDFEQKQQQHHRGLQFFNASLDECVCPVGSTEFRAPTRNEFRIAFNNTIQTLVTERELSFVSATEKVVEVDEVACDVDISPFVSSITLTSIGFPDQIERIDERSLTDLFTDTYNELAEGVCDPLFRTITSVRLLNLVDMEPDATTARRFIMLFKVVGRCRGCDAGTDFFVDATTQRRRDLQEVSYKGGGERRRLQLDDVCYCDTLGLLDRRPPTLAEFEAAYFESVSTLLPAIQIEGIEVVAEVPVEDSGGALEWQQLGNTLLGVAADDFFGYSTCMSEDGLTIGVGATQNNDGGTNAGHLRVFSYDPQLSTWVQLGQAISGQALDRLGSSCSMSADGNTVAAFSTFGRRAVDVYAFNPGRIIWEQIGASFSASGQSPVSLSGDGRSIVVGRSTQGLVRMYSFVARTNTWEPISQEINGEAGSQFAGSAVALSADAQSVVIGAYGNDDGGRDAGHVRVYTFSQELLRWVQLGQDVDGVGIDTNFGFAVAISGDARTIAVGAPGASENEVKEGEVRMFVYRNNGDAWSQLGQAIEGLLPNDREGESLALSKSGRTVAVGSYLHRGTTGTSSGQVRVFVYVASVETWVQRGAAMEGEGSSDYAGRGLAISGDGRIVVVGAPRNNNDNGDRSGQVRIFQWSYDLIPELPTDFTPPPTPSPTTPMPSVQSWIQVGQDIDGDEANDQLGSSVCMSADGITVAAGAIFNSDGGVQMGQLKVFRFNTQLGTWVQFGDDINGQANDRLGMSCSMNGNGQIVVVLTPFLRLATVHAYNSDFGVWRQFGQTINNVSGDNPLSLSSDGFTMALGYEPGNYARVMVYNFETIQWEQVGQNIMGQANSEFAGAAVALSSDGRIVAIGSPGNDDSGLDAGHVRIFELSSTLGRWTQLGPDVEIDGESAGDGFGRSIALASDGMTVAIGAPLNDALQDPVTNSRFGHVRVYSYGGDVWVQKGQEIDGVGVLDQAGTTVALSSDGNILGVGAPFHDGDIFSRSDVGHVRVFVYVESILTWVQRGPDIEGEIGNDRSATGFAMSEDGSRVAIGAPMNDSDGRLDAGHVRVFDWLYDPIPALTPTITPRPTSSLPTAAPAEPSWIQLGLDLDGEEARDGFGIDVCMSADGLTVAGTSIENNGGGNDSGQVRVFTFDSQLLVWVQKGQDIDGSENDRFGRRCSMSSDGMTLALFASSRREAVVFAYSAQTLLWTQVGDAITNVDGEYPISLDGGGAKIAVGTMSTGTVRVLQYRDTWDPVGASLAGEGRSQFFGHSVALSRDGNYLAVGATGNDDAGLDAGSVRVYSFQDNTWIQDGQDIDGESASDRFGYSLALSANGGTVAIGTPFNSEVGSNAGRVRVYVLSVRVWAPLGSDLNGTAANDWFGESVALSDDGRTVAISARFYDQSNTGQVSVYDYNDILDTWIRRGVGIDGEFPQDQFGTSVALSASGDIVASGAPGNNNDGRDDAGHVRVFEWVPSQPLPQ